MSRRLATGRGMSKRLAGLGKNRRLAGLGKESEISRVRERVGD